MKFAESKGIKAGQWFPNEMLREKDLNFLSEASYQNYVDELAVQFKHSLSFSDAIVGGLFFEHSTLLTCYLRSGIALSQQGAYYNSGIWGFIASSGKIFGVWTGDDTPVAFDTGGALDRYDMVEIRPVRTPYNSEARQFKDPITGLISSAIVKTKIEFGVEIAVRKGTEGAGVAPTRTAGWIKIAEVFIPASATSITDANIKDYRRSQLWTTEVDYTKRGSIAKPYSIAANDSPSEWKLIADKVLGPTEDLIAHISTLLGLAGEVVVSLAPGTFPCKSGIQFHATNDKLILEGCGSKTLLQSASPLTALTIFDMSAVTTGDFQFSDFDYDMGAYFPPATGQIVSLALGFATETQTRKMKWSNVRCRAITPDPGASTSITISAWKDCVNLSECSFVAKIEADAGAISLVYGFDGCSALINCKSIDYDSTEANNFAGFKYCTSLSNCNAFFTGDDNGGLIGFDGCQELCACFVNAVSIGSSSVITAYNGCYQASGCRFLGDSSGYTGGGGGMVDCSNISACRVQSHPHYGFAACFFVSGCAALGCSGGGFSNCYYVSSSRAGGYGFGFSGCFAITGSVAESNTLNGFIDCERVVGCHSINNGNYGFQGCKQCQQNWAYGNTLGQYITSYADQSLSGCANNATGGYNR